MPKNPKREVPYKKGTTCCAPNCQKSAEYEVYLYDLYPYSEPLEFFEQDYTCPFLCEEHMKENETLAKGIRAPRGFVEYPYSNKNNAQGYTKYAPLREVFPELFDGTSLIITPQVSLQISEVNEELMEHLEKHPELLRNLDPRKFEEVVAEIFKNQGYEVLLTPQTRDGGRDVQAVRKDAFGTLLYYIECKRYKQSRRVGVEVVRNLYGTITRNRATAGIIATTSSFTQDAIDFANPLQYQLSLRDFDALKAWLKTYKKQ